MALDNQQLIEAQKQLLDSFIELIAGAIDAKSPYTGGHCQRVPELTKMLVNAACVSTDKPFKGFDLDDDERYELHIAAWLHDCGKVTTPEYVVVKATKLETIYNRVHEIRTRFEVLKRDAEIEYWKARAGAKGDAKELKKKLDARIAELDDDYAFIAECAVGGEFMAEDRLERLKRIAKESGCEPSATAWASPRTRRIASRGIPEKPLPVKESLLVDKKEHVIPRQAHEVMAKDTFTASSSTCRRTATTRAKSTTSPSGAAR